MPRAAAPPTAYLQGMNAVRFVGFAKIYYTHCRPLDLLRSIMRAPEAQCPFALIYYRPNVDKLNSSALVMNTSNAFHASSIYYLMSIARSATADRINSSQKLTSGNLRCPYHSHTASLAVFIAVPLSSSSPVPLRVWRLPLTAAL